MEYEPKSFFSLLYVVIYINNFQNIAIEKVSFLHKEEVCAIRTILIILFILKIIIYEVIIGYYNKFKKGIAPLVLGPKPRALLLCYLNLVRRGVLSIYG